MAVPPYSAATSASAAFDQVAKIERDMRKCFSVLDHSREGIGAAEIEANPQQAGSSYEAVQAAFTGIECGMERIRRGLILASEAVDGEAAAIFRDHLDSAIHTVQPSLHTKMLWDFDYQTGVKALGIERELGSLAFRIERAVQQSGAAASGAGGAVVARQQDLEELCENFYGLNKLFILLERMPREQRDVSFHPSTEELIQRNRAQFQALMGQMETTFGPHRVREAMAEISRGEDVHGLDLWVDRWKNPAIRDLFSMLQHTMGLRGDIERKSQQPLTPALQKAIDSETQKLMKLQERVLGTIYVLPDSFKTVFFNELFGGAPYGDEADLEECLFQDVPATLEALTRTLHVLPQFTPRLIEAEQVEQETEFGGIAGHDEVEPRNFVEVERVPAFTDPRIAETLEVLLSRLDSIKENDKLDRAAKKKEAELAFNGANFRLWSIHAMAPVHVLGPIREFIYEHSLDPEKMEPDWKQNHLFDSIPLLMAAVNYAIIHSPSRGFAVEAD